MPAKKAFETQREHLTAFVAGFRVPFRLQCRGSKAMKAMAIVAMAAGAGFTARVARNVAVYLTNDLNTGGVMYQAQERAAKASAEVGVRIDWRTGRPPATQPEREPAIVVRLAEETPGDYLPGALAFAKVYEGVHITVFWDRRTPAATVGDGLMVNLRLPFSE